FPETLLSVCVPQALLKVAGFCPQQRCADPHYDIRPPSQCAERTPVGPEWPRLPPARARPPPPKSWAARRPSARPGTRRARGTANADRGRLGAAPEGVRLPPESWAFLCGPGE